MAQFDEIAQSGGDPVRHHTFYLDDGNVILSVSRSTPTGNDTYILRRYRACSSRYTSTSSRDIHPSSKACFG
jgi:hypothetical protein